MSDNPEPDIQAQQQNFPNAAVSDSQVGQSGRDLFQAAPDSLSANANKDSIQSNVKGTIVGDVNNAEKIITVGQQNVDIKQLFLGEKNSLEIRDFILNDAISFTEKELNYTQYLFVYPEEKLKDLQDCIEKHRLLLLTGPPKSGKFFTLKSLAFRISQQKFGDYNIKWFEPRLWESQIDLLEIINHSKELKNIILILRNIFSIKNKRLLNFFHLCSSGQIYHIFEKLKKINAYLLFTADSGNYEEYFLSNLIIKKSIYPLSDKLLSEGFDRRLKHFCLLSPKKDYSEVSQLLKSNKEEIIEKANCMSKIAFFFESELDKIIAGKSIDSSIEEVFDKKKYLKHFLTKELGEDKSEFETWTFIICLAMFNGAIYPDFYEMHRGITTFLLEKFDPFKTFKEFTFNMSERRLLEKCGARITRYGASFTYYIEFIDPSTQEDILDIVMNNYRNIVLQVACFLKEFMETQSRKSQRELAALNLVRISELAPDTILTPIIYEWGKKKNNMYRNNIGLLYVFIFQSKNNEYKKFYMRKLKRMALSDDINEQLTAIAAYKKIGLLNLEFAMIELRKIQEEVIEIDILKFFYSYAEKLNDQALVKALGLIFDETVRILSYILYSIVAFSTKLDPLDVIAELRKWINRGTYEDRNTVINVVLLFLAPGGILEELESIRIIYLSDCNEDKKKKMQINPLLHALCGGDEQIKKMVFFLNDMYRKCFPEFRVEVRKELKRKLFDHLERWAVASLYNSKVNDALKILFFNLYQIGNEELKDSMWNAINSWKLPKESDRQDVKNKEIMKEKPAKLSTFVNELKDKIIRS